MRFSMEQRLDLTRIYEETLSKHADVVEDARLRGFRLATVEEREFNRHEDLYTWRGTLWVTDNQ